MDDTKRILDKLDKIDERVDKIDITLVKQQSILEDHVRRSIANEDSLKLHREEFKPIQEHVLTVNLIFKAIIFLGVVVGIVQGIKEII
jgi:hypothetical protein